MAAKRQAATDLASRIARLWAAGQDTAAIAATVCIPEADVERIRTRQRELVAEARGARRGAQGAGPVARSVRASAAKRKPRAVRLAGDGPPPSAGEGGAEAVAQAAAQPTPKSNPICQPAHPPGTWPIADLGLGQCRFACTPHSARPEEHRFCGAPVAWRRGKPTSWCAEHLPMVMGAPGRSAGGASVADVSTAPGA